jgi:hypothetical protein
VLLIPVLTITETLWCIKKTKMAHKKKGQLTTSPEWAKHLRKYMKNQFWKGERSASKDMIRNELFETDNLKWQFEELLKTLIAMKSSLKEQENFYGIGATADEMLEDFNSYYTLNKTRLLERELINSESKNLLDQIDNLTDKWTSEKDEDFWFEMEKYDAEWNELRQKAKLTLEVMNRGDLIAIVNHENEFDKDGNILSQKTNVKLKEK